MSEWISVDQKPPSCLIVSLYLVKVFNLGFVREIISGFFDDSFEEYEGWHVITFENGLYEYERLLETGNTKVLYWAPLPEKACIPLKNLNGLDYLSLFNKE